MRNHAAWRLALTEEINGLKEVYGPLGLPSAQLLDFELILTLFAEYLPDQDPTLAWALLNGHPFPALQGLPVASRRAVAIARLRLPESIGRADWVHQMDQYKALASPYPLYRIDGTSLILQPTPVAPERRETMCAALQEAPALSTRPSRYVTKPGRYRFYLDRDPHEVEIPLEAIALKQGKAWDVSAPRITRREPLIVRWNDLLDEAGWMECNAPSGSAAVRGWKGLLENVRLSCVSHDDGTPLDELTLDGLLHLVGMVGSGKSTLLTILAVYLSRRGHRVVIVQGDVASLLREQEVLAAFEASDAKVSAVPLVGRSTRLLHLNRLHATEVEGVNNLTVGSHPGFAMLSTICPLDGLRQDVQPIDLGKEPCNRLYPSESEEDNSSHRRDCPLMPVCPIHFPTQQMSSANIWLATPASLLASGPQAPLAPLRQRNIELVMRLADVVLIDEADAVQVQFDDRFAPFEVLVGRHDAWLDRLGTQVARQIYRPSRPLIGRSSGLDRWLTVHQNTQRTVDRLYRWLRESAAMRIWLNETYFTGDLLLNRVQAQLEELGHRAEPFVAAREAFERAGLGGARGWLSISSRTEVWINVVQRELLAADEATSLQELSDWFRNNFRFIESMEEETIQELSHRLLIALLVSVLDHAFRDLIKSWNTAEEFLDLDRGSGGLFYNPSDDLIGLVPEAPMGPVIGFQYHDPENLGEGELRFFHVRGMGRALLYCLHDGLWTTEGIAGPHVVLTSGTSWAPTSWRYHLHVPPAALLQSTSAEHPDVSCFFEPLADPDHPQRRLSVSGKKSASERMRSLKSMVNDLSRPSGFSTQRMSKFDRELELLDHHRRRILLVVGSYAEAEAVGEALADALKSAPGEDVLTLIPDGGDDPVKGQAQDRLLRSRVSQFALSSARFLVAPLQAMERGHNILVGQEGAIGSIYFLVRPFPRPGDPHAAIQRMNAWASEYVPTLLGLQAGEAGQRLREAAYERWKRDLQGEETYKGTIDKTALLWTQLVLVWQCIGRLLRGGAAARVHFIDAKWAEVTSGLSLGRVDTEESSMLIGFQRVLTDALNSAEPMERRMTQALYGPFLKGLIEMKGIYRE